MKGRPIFRSSNCPTEEVVTGSLIARKRQHTVQARVLARLASAYWSDAEGHGYSFEETIGDGDILEAILPDEKFTNYLFNTDHKDGRSKAKFFTEELGILPNDWRYLAAQFYEGLVLSEPRDLVLSHGAKAMVPSSQPISE